MDQKVANSRTSQCDAPVELVGEVDHEAIDRLAELLIDAARRQQQENVRDIDADKQDARTTPSSI